MRKLYSKNLEYNINAATQYNGAIIKNNEPQK